MYMATVMVFREKVVEHLEKHEDITLHEPIFKARLLTDGEVDRWEKYKATCEWIPCSDRLPEESLNSVIGWDEYRKRCCFVQYYGGRWILGHDIESVKITAQQPLPEPYKMQEMTE